MEMDGFVRNSCDQTLVGLLIQHVLHILGGKSHRFPKILIQTISSVVHSPASFTALLIDRSGWTILCQFYSLEHFEVCLEEIVRV